MHPLEEPETELWWHIIGIDMIHFKKKQTRGNNHENNRKSTTKTTVGTEVK